jgi:pterin-4a-carbinolamine dehydratase
MPLTEDQITEHLKNFTGWTLQDGAISKAYRFSGFMKAMEFVNKCAIAAAHLNRYPRIEIEGNMVTFHIGDEEGITDQDFKLIKDIEPLALEFL